MRATFCPLIIVCVILFCSTAVCRSTCVVVSLFGNTRYVSQCGVCVTTD